MPSSSSITAATTTKPRKSTATSSTSNHHHHHNNNSSPLFCRHHSTTTSASFSATLDLLILILVVISGTFLIASYFSYLFTSLSLLLPTIPLPLSLPPPAYLAGVAFALSILAVVLVLGLFRRRRCGNEFCKGLKKALEFDLQLQTEETMKSSLGGDFEMLPWKGGSESNPDYECLRAELRKMAPVNGRAVLLFRAKCGCPVAKLIGWGAKKAPRKHKKGRSVG